jgi:magnesium-transporting ATPase (P-type)
MLDTAQNIVIVIVSLACSLSFMAAVNYYWPREKRQAHNDLIGWQLSVLGTTYAVIIGFMLYTVWINFGEADLNSDAEANSLVNVYRLSSGLAPEEGAKLRALTRAYGDAVVDNEWGEMANNIMPEETRAIARQMWATLMASKAASPTEITAEDHAIREVSALAGYRRIRMVESASRLPGVLWFVLIVGGVVTIASTCMFGAANSPLHIIQVSAFALLISLVLVAIADINRPFQGSVHVSDYAFRRAQVDMKDQ